MTAIIPNDAIDGYVDAYKHACQRLAKSGMPWTADVAEKMTVSAMILAERSGYWLIVGGPDAAQDAPQEVNPDWQQPNAGFNYDSPHPVSEKQKDKIAALLEKAVRVVVGSSGKSDAQAEKVINVAIHQPFLEQRGHEANLTSFTRMTSGDASWVIDFIQRTWDVR